MKYFLLIGGFGGFTAALVGGIAVGNDISLILRNACIGCLVGALLLRGFRALILQQLRELADQQARAKESADTQPSA